MLRRLLLTLAASSLLTNACHSGEDDGSKPGLGEDASAFSIASIAEEREDDMLVRVVVAVG